MGTKTECHQLRIVQTFRTHKSEIALKRLRSLISRLGLCLSISTLGEKFEPTKLFGVQ
jgi:hypothetical protein